MFFSVIFMPKPAVFTLSTLSLILIFLSYSLPAYTVSPLSAVDYAQRQLIKAGWRIKAAKAVVTVNRAWFTILKQKHENDFHHQINLLKQLGHSVILSQFLHKHPETAGLLALSDNPILLVKTLKKPACYNAITSFYALHTSPKDIQLLTQALEIHRDLMCKLADRGLLGAAIVFIFPRHTRGAIEYDVWLEKVFDKYLQLSDEKLIEILGFLIENGQTIRQHLDKNHNFYKRFRQELWPTLMRVVDNKGAFDLHVNEPHIWNMLALKEGELLLHKWGLAPISLLFGEGSYPADLHPLIIQILLQGDDNMVEALFRYKDEPLFHNLMRRPLSATTQAALANKLVSLCPNYPEQACPNLPYQLRYFTSITDNAALAEEVGILQTEPITWIPFHGTYYAIKKMTQGRKLSSDDMLNMVFDALIFVPAAFFAGPYSGTLQPLGQEIAIGVVGLGMLSFTPYPYHLIKPLGKFMIRTGNRTRNMLIEETETEKAQKLAFRQEEMIIIPNASEQFSDQLGALRIFYGMTKSQLLLFLHKHKKAGHQGYHKMKLVKFEASVFMCHDAKVVINPASGLSLSDQFFRETAERALSPQAARRRARLAKREVSAWQQNISAWWLMNAAIAQ
jgi:hypothetical protein